MTSPDRTRRPRRVLMLTALAFCTAVCAQEPPDPPPAAEPASAATSASGSEGRDSDGASADAPTPAIGEDVPEDPGALVEEDAAIAASAEEEFNPDEEISEDYPVPLPSDI